MKQKRQERVERRRPLIEMNLIGEQPRPRATRKRAGCLRWLPVLVVAAVLFDVSTGLLLR